MSERTPPAELVARARDLYEAGASLRDVGKDVGKSRETIRRWATSGGWTAPLVMAGADGAPKPVPSTEDLEAARMRADKARQEAAARWAIRRSEEADRVGLSAGRVRQKIMEFVEAGKAAEARQLATVYGIFVDKAMVMSAEGGNPARGRQGDEPGPSVHGPRPTDPREMAAAGRQRALALVPSVDVTSREKQA